MFRKSWSALSLMVFVLLLVAVAPSARAQPNVIAKVIITDEEMEAQAREGKHPLVIAHVSVLDDKGRQVSGLRKEDFTIKEWPKPISEFSVSEERQGVAVALLVDVSGSMEDRGLSGTRLKDAREAVKRFVEKLDEKDMVSIFTFAKEVERIQPLTAGREGMEDWVAKGIAVPSGEAGKYTSLFDAVYEAIGELTASEERWGPGFARMKKAIFVFSDGMDNASLHNPSDVRDKLLKEDPKGKISVYAVGVGSEEIYDAYKARFDDLIKLADFTQGKFIHYFGKDEEEAASAKEELDRAFDRFLSQRMQYVISYPTEACADIVRLSVEVNGRADEAEVKIPPVDPIVKLSGVQEGQMIWGKVDLKPEILLEQCPIREITYFVNGQKMVTMGPPFTWKWDTSALPFRLETPPTIKVDEQGNGLIESVVVRMEAIDQKGRVAADEVSGLTVKILPPEIKVRIRRVIERRGSWRTSLEDTKPKELPVEIKIAWPGQPRKIKKVEYYLNGQLMHATASLEHKLDISTLGDFKKESRLTLKVRAIDELGLFKEVNIPLTVKVHGENFWEAVSRIAGRQFRLSTLPTWIALAAAIAALVLFLTRPRMVVAPVREAFVKVTEALGIVEKAELLEIGEDGKIINRYRVRQQMSLGRDPRQVDIAFDEPHVSRLHASLVKEGEDFVLYDEGSKWGTWVNKRRLRFKGSQVLRDGDVIGLGPAIRLRFKRKE